VPPDFHVGTVGKGCSMVAAIESANVQRWLNVILDLNGALCSCIQKSTVTRRGPQQKPYYVDVFLHSPTIPTCVGPKAVYVRPSVANFMIQESDWVRRYHNLEFHNAVHSR
jgi:hypothetical protein